MNIERRSVIPIDFDIHHSMFSVRYST